MEQPGKIEIGGKMRPELRYVVMACLALMSYFQAEGQNTQPKGEPMPPPTYKIDNTRPTYMVTPGTGSSNVYNPNPTPFFSPETDPAKAEAAKQEMISRFKRKRAQQRKRLEEVDKATIQQLIEFDVETQNLLDDLLSGHAHLDPNYEKDPGNPDRQ
jgi:hypothetical protein